MRKQTDDKEELRLKIKKLKYKISKEEELLAEYYRSINQLNKIDEQQLSLSRALKKVDFLLNLKGLTLVDWFRAYPYEEDVELYELVDVLQKIGIKLPRGEKSVLINFMGGQIQNKITFEDFKRLASDNGMFIRQN